MWRRIAILASCLAPMGVFAVAPAAGAGEYKPLPSGTTLVYDDHQCTLQAASGFTSVCNLADGTSLSLFGQLVSHGTIPKQSFHGALRRRDSLQLRGIRLDEQAKTSLAALWPLAVGKSASYSFEAQAKFARHGWQSQVLSATVTVSSTITVTEETTVQVAGESQKVLVITEVTRPFQVPYLAASVFERVWWVNAETGVVVKGRTSWTKGPNLGIWVESTLASISWPPGYAPQIAKAPPPAATVVPNASSAQKSTVQPQVVVATPEPSEPALNRNERQRVQQQLTVLGFYDRGIDGSFGPGTRAAIRRFQAAHGLEATGYLDPPALAVLADAARAREDEIAKDAAQQAAVQQAAQQRGAQEAERKAAEEQARARAAALEQERLALEAQREDLKRQQEELLKAQQQAAQVSVESERKAAEEQARVLAEQLQKEKDALEAQRLELKRQQDEVLRAQQEAEAARAAAEAEAAKAAAEAEVAKAAAEAEAARAAAEAVAPAAPPPEEAPTASAAPAGDFASVIATLQPIDEVFVAVKPAKIRSAPNVAAARVGSLDVGDKIAVLGRLPNQDWYLVARDDQPIGYVVASQLAAPTDGTRTSPEAPPPPDILETAAPAQDGATLPPELAALDFGSYHALVIGNNNYRDLPKLATAVADAEGVAAVLEKNYGFNVRLMTNASEEDIIGALTDMRRDLAFGDNLLVYYAGHGWYDEDTEQGYWLPIDASEDNQSNWISNADITTGLKALKAKHIIVVADSCFSGTLARGAKPSLRGIDYVERIVKKKARTVLTSGGREPVMDSGGGGHSVFARAFLTALEENDSVIDGQELFRRLRDSVVANAPQTPEYSDIRGAGHDGGDFLFVRR